MTTVALIPARGGSKRLPRKNILELAGRPLLAYPIAAAQAAGIFDQICVSTEDEEIARVAERFGARVIERPPEIAADSSTVVQVCLHALEASPEAELLCCIYATAALIQPASLVAGYQLIRDDQDTDFVMAVSEFEHPPVQALKADEHGHLSYMWPEWRGVQSQSYPPLVVSNGAFYWARRNALLKEKTFYGERLRGLSLPSSEVSDIDTYEDLELLRRKLDGRP
jgi:pseudaminic acid cytidylyltransferase